jgi:hypothetical protein
MEKDPAQYKIPRSRKITLVEYFGKASFSRLVLMGISIYIFFVALFSGIEFFIQSYATYFGKAASGFWELMYFNFITILTVGYGDYSPKGVFRPLSILEAFIGVGIYSFFVAVLTVKSLLPKKHAVVFSKYAYYCLDKEKFLIIFLNTSTENLSNAEICSYFKLNEDWAVTPSVRAPFITKSVQTFFVGDCVSPAELKTKLHRYDCLRVGISGGLGMSTYLTSIEYGLKEIIVIPGKNVLTNYKGFWDVDGNLNSEEFNKFFHYAPKQRETLGDWCRQGI